MTKITLNKTVFKYFLEVIKYFLEVIKYFLEMIKYFLEMIKYFLEMMFRCSLEMMFEYHDKCLNIMTNV